MDNREENRNCMFHDNNMNNECQYTPQGINAAFGFNTAQILSNDMNCCNSCNQEECMEDKNRVRNGMINQIKCLNFAVVDIAEYLDTHPESTAALKYFNKFNRMSIAVSKELQERYGAVNTNLDTELPEWSWVNMPWPWNEGV